MARGSSMKVLLKQTMKKINWLGLAQVIIVFVLALTPLVIPHLAMAQSGEVGEGLGKIKEPFGEAAKNNKDVYSLAQTVIRIMLQMGFAIAIIFVMVGGYMYITSAGNEEQAGKGRKTVVYALIGMVIIIMAWVIVDVVSKAAINPSSI